ncbi:MAG TPA: DUF488 family protein [Micromonosporaceae bacterium]|nr:DUF488 family protein [Micromonosporaceae bacterium]
MTAKHRAPAVSVKRVYEPAEPGDGARVLVDRLWPRGLASATAGIDDWVPAVAPSTTLRRWFGHDPTRFDEFRRRYLDELTDDEHTEPLRILRDAAERGPLTVLTATKDVSVSHASILVGVITKAP